MRSRKHFAVWVCGRVRSQKRRRETQQILSEICVTQAIVAQHLPMSETPSKRFVAASDSLLAVATKVGPNSFDIRLA